MNRCPRRVQATVIRIKKPSKNHLRRFFDGDDGSTYPIAVLVEATDGKFLKANIHQTSNLLHFLDRLLRSFPNLVARLLDLVFYCFPITLQLGEPLADTSGDSNEPVSYFVLEVGILEGSFFVVDF